MIFFHSPPAPAKRLQQESVEKVYVIGQRRIIVIGRRYRR